MPTYEFQCRKCRQVFEITCATKDRERDYPCEYCGAHGAARVIGSGVTHRWSSGIEGVSQGWLEGRTEDAKRKYGVKK